MGVQSSLLSELWSRTYKLSCRSFTVNPHTLTSLLFKRVSRMYRARYYNRAGIFMMGTFDVPHGHTSKNSHLVVLLSFSSVQAILTRSGGARYQYIARRRTLIKKWRRR